MKLTVWEQFREKIDVSLGDVDLGGVELHDVHEELDLIVKPPLDPLGSEGSH